MKECEQIGDLFSELHDQDLEGEIEKAAREHLHNCSCCREEFKWYGITVQALTQLERVPPPHDFLTQLHVRLDTCSPSYSFLHSLRNFFSTLPQLPVPVGVTALTCVVAVAWAAYSYAPPVTLPTGGTSSIAYGPTGSAENVDVTTRSGVWQTTPGARADRIMARTQETAPLGRAGTRSSAALQTPGMAKSLTPTPLVNPLNIKTVGSDNLTVESPSINLTVESVKRLLPNLHGRLVDEQSHDGRRRRCWQ